jgi:protease-4
MSDNPLRKLGRGIAAVWGAVDASRRFVMNFIFLLIVIFILTSMFSSSEIKVEDKTALLLEIKGDIVEQHAGGSRDVLMAELNGENKRSTQLRDILAALQHAAKDPKISSVVLNVEGMGSAGLASLREVAAAIIEFKASGKKVVAWGSDFNQRQYFLAAHANEVYLHPMGNVFIKGFGGYSNYYRDALDKIGVTVNVLKVGKYKNFAEPYIANGPSDASKEAQAYLYSDLWKTYTTDVEKARKLKEGAISDSINNLPELVKVAKGSMAQVALNAKWVDGLKTRDQVDQLMLGLGAKDPHHSSYRNIKLTEYLATMPKRLFGEGVGVIIAEGEISGGMAPAGSIGGLSTANLIRDARENSQIKSIVLRVNSPGGSAFGSELIRHELELTKKAGKPVVISMGDVAASGGYWISMTSDEVIADSATITGSIGVFGIIPTFEKVMDKVGVHTAGTTTTWLAGADNIMRPLDPRFAELVQAGVENIYREFTTKAAVARKTTPEKIDEFAQGRVWTGTQAKERGLIDRVGSFKDALKSAATLAKLPDTARVIYVEPEMSKIDKFLSMFGDSAAKIITDKVKADIGASGIPVDTVTKMAKEFTWITEMKSGNQAFMPLTHCFCKVE